MTPKTLFFFILILFLNLTVVGQDKEVFPGENLLSQCKVDLPLTYRSKDRNTCKKTAEQYKDVKLVLFQYNKKTKTAAYYFYYVVKEEGKNDIFIYLETPGSHAAPKGEKEAIFLKFSTKTDRFYTAECFEEMVKNNQSLFDFAKAE